MTEALNRFALDGARDSLATYIAGQWPGLKPARHLEILVGELEAVERGETKRLLVSLPPGHAKSTTASQSFPAWFLGRRPDRYVISASHTAELSTDFGKRVLGLVQSPLHRAVFPDCELAGDVGAATRFNLTRGGAYYAVGLGGAITGRRAHLLVVDDPAKDPGELRSAAYRRAMKDWFTSVGYTRLMPDGAIIVCATRMHEEDMIGWLQKEHAADGWRVISMPAIAEEDEGWRKAGDALWPEMFPLEALERIRTNVGGATWQALYQQNPSAAEGRIWQRQWWNFVREPPPIESVIQSWDTAFKAGAENDYSVGITIGVRPNGYFVLHVLRERLEFPELKRKMIELSAQWKPSRVLIEDKASGQSAIQALRDETALPIFPIKVDADKITRASAASALVEAGRVFLPEPSTAAWVDVFLDEISSFPNAAHDDQVDALSQGLNYLRGDATGTAIMEYYDRLLARRVESNQPESDSPEAREARRAELEAGLPASFRRPSW